jgi:hypothetical protein
MDVTPAVDDHGLVPGASLYVKLRLFGSAGAQVEPGTGRHARLVVVDDNLVSIGVALLKAYETRVTADTVQ